MGVGAHNKIEASTLRIRGADLCRHLGPSLLIDIQSRSIRFGQVFAEIQASGFGGRGGGGGCTQQNGSEHFKN